MGVLLCFCLLRFSVGGVFFGFVLLGLLDFVVCFLGLSGGGLILLTLIGRKFSTSQNNFAEN